RQNKLRQKMIDGKVDVLVVSFGPNVRYLSGFTGSNGVLLVLLERAIFLTDPRYKIQAAQEVSCPVQVGAGPLLPRVNAVLKRSKSKRVGFEQSRMSFEGYQFLKEHLPLRTSLEPVAGWVEQLRMVKSQEEI